MKISIIIPIYNEEKTLENIIQQVENSDVLGLEKELILVDDCSQDGTRKILEKYQSRHKVIFHEKNQGKGAGLRTGFKNASGDIIIIQDADLEYDPNEYPKLLKPILDNKADVVFGSRFVGGQSHRILYFWHTMTNKFLTVLSNVFSDLNLTDMETCYKVFRKEIIDQIEIEENRFGFEPEITAKIGELTRTKNIRLYEVGISYYGRTYNEGKKIGWKDAARAFWCIFKYNTSKFAHLVKYGINGIFVALSQIIAIYILVKYFNFSTNSLQQIANIISIEISILVGLFLHSFLTWRYQYETTRNFFKVFIYFHLITGISFLVRMLLFPILSLFGIDYMTNTLIGVLVAIIINFFGYDKVVFKNKLEDIIYKK
jgi:glycosyltransferase involved in cell wall biosynthesis